MSFEDLCAESRLSSDCVTWNRWLAEIEHRSKEKAKRSNWGSTENRYRASALCYPCMLKVMLDIKFPVDFDDKTKSTLAVGDVVHEQIEGLYPDRNNEANTATDVEFNVKDGDEILFTITGHYDLYDEEQSILSDVKSWGFLTGVRVEPKWHHVRQVNLYAGILGADICELIYVQKTDFDMVEWRWPFNKELFDKTIRDAKSLRDHFRNSTYPKPCGGDYCRWCKHKSKCREVKKHGTVIDVVEL